MATSPRAAAARRRPRRRSPGWVPNQHGAWAMLGAPLLVGTLASSPSWVHLPLTLFWFTGYFAFFASGLWLKAPARRRARLRPPVLTYAASSALLGALTLALHPGLVRWAPLFLVPLAVGLWSSWRRAERSLLSGLATTAGSCLMTLVAYDAGGGADWTRAWVLTGVLAAYFAGTVLYVKTMIRERGNETYRWLSLLWHAGAAAAATRLSGGLVLVFALLTVRAAVLPAFRVSPKALGFGEVASTIVVGAVALLAT